MNNQLAELSGALQIITEELRKYWAREKFVSEPLNFALINAEKVLEQYYDQFHACKTGDCDHQSQAECNNKLKSKPQYDGDGCMAESVIPFEDKS